MGANQSKEERLYQEVQNGNHDAVKSLRRDGASLEWVDKEGRTPLILACTRGELLDMVITLLNLGANMNAYRSGAHGGFPLHHAAKRGLEKTVTLLLSRGANPLAVNDDNHTPLDVARDRGHVAVVRLLEEKLCLFSGALRELSGFGILESFAPKLVTKKIWAVVLPTKLHARGAAVCELAIYESPKVSLWSGVHSSSAHPAGLCNVAKPRTSISLINAEVEKPDFTLADPVLYVTDKIHKMKYKLYAENKGDKAQIERLYKACRGISLAYNGVPCGNDLTSHTVGHPAVIPQQGNLSQIHPMSLQPSPGNQPVQQTVTAPSLGVSSSVNLNSSAAEPIPEELALALALDESIRTANEEGIPISPTASNVFNLSQLNEWDVADGSYRGWGPTDLNKQQERAIKAGYSGWKAEQSAYNNWTQAGSGPCSVGDVSVNEQPIVAPPSAPPLPEEAGCNSADGAGGICVVCWDARAEGACIPCGHLAGCMNCLMEVKSKRWSCPVCRGPIEQVIKVYTV
eukprot:c22477_g1_i1 orf=432-1976(+)